jgi:hypothetical protein
VPVEVVRRTTTTVGGGPRRQREGGHTCRGCGSGRIGRISRKDVAPAQEDVEAAGQEEELAPTREEEAEPWRPYLTAGDHACPGR